MSNPAQNTVIYTTQPAADHSQQLVIGTGGNLVLGTVTIPNPPTTSGTWTLQVVSGVASWVS